MVEMAREWLETHADGEYPSMGLAVVRREMYSLRNGPESRTEQSRGIRYALLPVDLSRSMCCEAKRGNVHAK